MPTLIDSHVDSAWRWWKHEPDYKPNLAAFKKGYVRGVFFALYAPSSSKWPEMMALEQYEWLRTHPFSNGDNAPTACCGSVNSWEDAWAEGLFTYGITMENGGHIVQSAARLESWWRRGILAIGLVHKQDNWWAGSCTGSGSGLTKEGERAIREMNRLGILVDVSHASDAAFWRVLDIAKSGTVLASHSACRALHSHPRNLTDGMIRALADHGGTVQIPVARMFFAKDDWHEVLRHVEHVVSIAGERAVGIGSDFDGAHPLQGLEDVSEMEKVVERLPKSALANNLLRMLDYGKV